MKNIVIVGVGGQGILLSSYILGEIAKDSGYDVKISEVHGMAQRGGSVITHVRYAPVVFSPLIEPKEADIIVSFELLEALRYEHFLKPKGLIIVNKKEIVPSGAQVQYPSDIERNLVKNHNTIVVEASSKSSELGNPKMVNTILLGRLARELEFPYDNWLKVLRVKVKPQYVEENLKAFSYGYSL